MRRIAIAVLVVGAAGVGGLIGASLVGDRSDDVPVRVIRTLPGPGFGFVGQMAWIPGVSSLVVNSYFMPSERLTTRRRWTAA